MPSLISLDHPEGRISGYSLCHGLSLVRVISSTKQASWASGANDVSSLHTDAVNALGDPDIVVVCLVVCLCEKAVATQTVSLLRCFTV